MPRIHIKFELDPEYADPDHSSGITEEANDKITDFVNTMGSDLDISVDD